MTERFRISNVDGERLDAALSERYESLSRSKIAQAIRTGCVTVNGNPVKASYRLQACDEVAVDLNAFELEPIAPEDIALDVLYEDTDIAVINKPYAMIVHPTEAVRSGTLVNALLGRFDRLSNLNGDLRPGIVHRLDADTTGAIIIAKTNAAHERLVEAFKRHEVTKTYLAAVEGRWQVSDEPFSGAIGRNPNNRKLMAVVPDGKPALSRFTTLAISDQHSLLAVQIVSGRTHQIRVHLKALGHPVVGDRLYGYRHQTVRVAHQLLHAHRLGFAHPISGEPLTIEAPLDACMRDALMRMNLASEDLDKIRNR